MKESLKEFAGILLLLVTAAAVLVNIILMSVYFWTKVLS